MFRYAVSPPGARRFRITGEFDRLSRACFFCLERRVAGTGVPAVGWHRPGKLDGKRASRAERGGFIPTVFSHSAPVLVLAGRSWAPPRCSSAPAAFRRDLRRSPPADWAWPRSDPSTKSAIFWAGVPSGSRFSICTSFWQKGTGGAGFGVALGLAALPWRRARRSACCAAL